MKLFPPHPRKRQTTTGYGELPAFGRKLNRMQVPPDLASRITRLAESFGRSPEAFLREAISHLLEISTPAVAPPATPGSSNGFTPQPQGFSVYE